MNPNPFEDPAKTELRGRTEVAIDAAGHELVVPAGISLPVGSSLTGKILGDLQSANGEQERFVYYLRTHGEKAIPQWLANLAGAAHQIENCRLYIVVPATSAVMERSCQSSGAGLLKLTDENTFDHIINFDDLDPDELHGAFLARAAAVRRRMEEKLEMKKRSLSINFQRVEELTVGMEVKKRDEYVGGVTDGLQAWTEWGDSVSAKLDEAVGLDDEEILKAAEKMINEGAVGFEDEDEDEDDEATGPSA